MLDSALVWFRRDLRDVDNLALSEACRRARRVFCAFVFDRDILDQLPSKTDRRVAFIHGSLLELDRALRKRGGGLIVRHGRAVHEVPRLAQELGVAAVFANRDYEPDAKARDASVSNTLAQAGIAFEAFKDQVVFDSVEVLTKGAKPYTVFTPYRNAWLNRLREGVEDQLHLYREQRDNFSSTLACPEDANGIPSLATLGFRTIDLSQLEIVPGMSGGQECFERFMSRMERYAVERDFPDHPGVSKLSVHLRFGTVSIRRLVAFAIEKGALSGVEGPATWLAELIWREFYFMILDQFPHVVTRAFRPEYDALAWESGRHADELFAAWCEGRTGYPFVDAGMRQLNMTGYMHNRLRMVTASFLVKDLGIEWRHGEAYFAHHLNDFDLAANNGGWQWVASTGCDAQPYFRIFNPLIQSERFDPRGDFIRNYLPELATVPDRYIHAPWRMSRNEQQQCGVVIGTTTPAPIIDHAEARQQTLQRYAVTRPRF